MNATAQAEVFCPAGLDFSTLNERIEEGCGKINDNGALTVDLSNLDRVSTLTICLLLALLRTAHERECRLTAVNIAPQLRKLLNLYQIDNILPEA